MPGRVGREYRSVSRHVSSSQAYLKLIEQRAQKTQANVAALQATQQREHRHRDHRHRSSRPVDGAQAGANGSPIILTPAAAQIKDRDRERVRRQHSNQARELAMSVQPIPPTSRQGSHLNREREREGNSAALPGTHPYASATASPASPNGGATPGGTFPRTTTNSPLPPIPGDERERGLGTSNSNVALATQSAVHGPGQTYSYANGSGSAQTMSRGMSAARMDGLGYGGQGVGGVIEEEPPRHRGFLALLCCRS